MSETRKGPRPNEERSTGLEGAAEEGAGVVRPQPVEGGEELSIGGGPPKGAGGEKHPTAPTQHDLRDPEER